MTARQSDRRAELARIHCLRRDIGLAEDDYRNIIATIGRVPSRSAADLDHIGRAQVIAHLASLARRYEALKNDWIARAAPDRQPLLRKIMALAGDRGKGYCDGIAKHMFRIERLEFCAPDQLRKVVAALHYDQRRHAAKGAGNAGDQ